MTRRRPASLFRGTLFGGLLLAGTLGLCTGCHPLQPPTPIAQLNADQTRGYMVFQTRCATCHYERLNAPKNGPSLEGIFQKPYLPSGAPANDDRVSATIQHGHGMMPAQPDIDPDSLQVLLAYLHTV